MYRTVLLTFILTMTLGLRASGQRLSYVAVVLDSESQQMLQSWAEAHRPWEQAIYYGHHSTIAHHTNITPELDAWSLQCEGTRVWLCCTEVGYSSKALALKVDEPTGRIPCVNAVRHITLATNPAEDGRAVDSNDITDWQVLSAPLWVRGTVQRVMK